MTKTALNFIGGKWQHARSGATFETRNPATLELLAYAAQSDADDVADAVAAAKAAFREWRLVPAPRRGEVLYAVARVLKNARKSSRG